MVVNERPLKRRRRVTADLRDFFTFPATGDAVSGAPFRSTVQYFLSRHARPTFPPSLFPCLMTWQIPLRIDDQVAGGDGGRQPAVVTLYVVEEDVTRSSRSVYCDQCRVVGWSGHPVCRKRYHFIIRAESNDGSSSPVLQEEGCPRTCSVCGNLWHFSDSRCKSCNYVFTEDDLEDWLYLQFEDTTHLLHGVVHSNGYGHLLTLNGREGGSKVLSGCDTMNFWDRLCQTLAVRKISVMDVSKKYGMEYRLLHAITHGHPWYGNWGYEFGAGSYAITQDAYQQAVTTISSIPISLFSYHRRRPRTHLQDVIAFYQSISESKLATLRDLVSLMLRLIQKPKKPLKPGTCEDTSELCEWKRDDIERVEQAMIKVLLVAAGDACWVSRCSLKGALCKASPPKLLDYCLKHLGGKLAANGMVVNTRYNHSSATVEFRLEPSGFVHDGTNSDQPSEDHLIGDLKFLYDSILHPQTMVSYRPQVTRELVSDSAAKLLDCKKFVKDYNTHKMEAVNPFTIHLWCHVELADYLKDDPAPPPEPIILPETATIADLKLEAAKTFQEVYAMFKKFEADEMLDYGPLDDSMTLKLLVGSRGSVRVRGRCLGTHGLNRFRMERGTENWTVDCICGAKDDDGEKMLACDTCGIWQHTRCAGLDNHDAVPAKFVCMRCLNSYQTESNKDAQPNEGTDKVMRSSRTCRAKAVATNGRGHGSSFTTTVGVR